VTYSRTARHSQPADERSGRMPPHILAGIMDGSVRILATVLPDGRPSAPRQSTPPSEAKAAAFRATEALTETACEMAAPLAVACVLSAIAVVGLVLSLPV
jgi:hypothetical protein